MTDLPMMTISLWQPWASACVLGFKAIETRHWRTPYRGELAIHAAKRLTAFERDWWAKLHEIHPIWPAKPILGAIVGVVELTAIEPTERLIERISDTESRWGNYGPGRFGWMFSNPRALPRPIECRGNQSMWRLSPELDAEVRAQLHTAGEISRP
jgi:activating signal cointegrator 1